MKKLQEQLIELVRESDKKATDSAAKLLPLLSDHFLPAEYHQPRKMMTLTTLMVRMLGRLKVCSTSLLTASQIRTDANFLLRFASWESAACCTLTDSHILPVWLLVWLLGKCISMGLWLYKLYLYHYLK